MRMPLPHRAVFGLAWPMIISNISLPLLGLVDTAILGHLDDAKYLAAVAAGSAVLAFLFWGFGFLRMGTTSLVARAMGKQDHAACRQLLWQGLVMAFALGILLMVLRSFIFPVAMLWIKPSAAVVELAINYCQIRIYSAPAALANFAVIGWFIGMQNTRAPLSIMVTTNLLNILLDGLFVLVLGMKSDGAALATAMADYGGLVLGLLLVRRSLGKLPGKLVPAELVRPAAYRELLRVNRQLFVRTTCLLFTFAFFTAQGARLGDTVLAANAILMQLLLLTSHGLDGFAHAAEALVGKAVGGSDRSALPRVCKAATVWSLIVAVGFTVFFIVFESHLVALLSDIDTVSNAVLHYYIWLYPLPLISVWSYLFDGIFIGAGKTSEMQNTMLMACLGIFVPIWWLTLEWGNHGLWFAFLCFNAARGLLLGAVFWRYSERGRWF